MDTEIILASSSPSRKMLFENIGIPFRVAVSGADENVPETMQPYEKVEVISRRKLEAVRGYYPNSVVIAADSLISFGGSTLGKPESEKAAAEMLKKLSGNVHQVVTGVSIAYKQNTLTFSQATDVEFYKLSCREIEEYVNSGESMGRAGSYGIEGIGALLIKSIKGDYSNVVGIPLGETFRRVRDILAME